MKTLSRDELFSLEDYAEKRTAFRAEVMAHKKNRQVPVGPHATLYFEDRVTIQYQIQEMLRAERIFEAAAIEDELAAYNPLIPDGMSWKATFMIEYDDVDERRTALENLVGIENRIWVQIDTLDKVYPIADEDLERETDAKTSAVHFLRFELNAEMVTAAKTGAPINIGIDHPAYQHDVTPVSDNIRAALAGDLD